MNEFLNLKFQERRFFDYITTFPKKDKKILLQAYQLAKKFHSGQERDEGGAYVIHCLRVACSLIEELNVREPSVICAGLLHDTIEDTDLELEEVTRRFGTWTGEIVGNLTRKKEGETKQNKYQRKYQKLLEIMKMDKETRVVKACDWLDNVRSWPHISKSHPARKKFKRWSREAEKMYLPLARSLNAKLAKKMESALAKVKAGAS